MKAETCFAIALIGVVFGIFITPYCLFGAGYMAAIGVNKANEEDGIPASPYW